MSLIDESLYKSAESDANENSTKPGRNVPKGRKRVAYRKMVLGLIFLGVYVALSGSYNFTVSVQPWFEGHNIVYRYVACF